MGQQIGSVYGEEEEELNEPLQLNSYHKDSSSSAPQRAAVLASQSSTGKVSDSASARQGGKIECHISQSFSSSSNLQKEQHTRSPAVSELRTHPQRVCFPQSKGNMEELLLINEERRERRFQSMRTNYAANSHHSLVEKHNCE